MFYENIRYSVAIAAAFFIELFNDFYSFLKLKISEESGLCFCGNAVFWVLAFLFQI